LLADNADFRDAMFRKIECVRKIIRHFNLDGLHEAFTLRIEVLNSLAVPPNNQQPSIGF